MEEKEDKKMVDLLKNDQKPILPFMFGYFRSGAIWAFDVEFLNFFSYFAFLRNKKAAFWQKFRLLFVKWGALFLK